MHLACCKLAGKLPCHCVDLSIPAKTPAWKTSFKMPLGSANQAQLIRSCQKDEFYQSFLRNNANEAFQTFAGCKRWLEWRKEIELLSDITYYGLTTLSGYQTLGEEYVNIIQVDPSRHRIPSHLRRGFFILCHTFLPYLLDKVLVCLKNELEGRQEPRQQQKVSAWWNLESWLRRHTHEGVRRLSEAQKTALLQTVSVLQQSLTLLHRLHTALFYIFGSFYHLSRRATGIRYLRVSGRSSDDSTIWTSYRLLGLASLMQLFIVVSLQVRAFRQKQRSRQERRIYRNLQPHSSNETISGFRSARCTLCLEGRRQSTCTPCGHLFCWDCITEWSRTKAECPLCRVKFQPHRLVFLRNYS